MILKSKFAGRRINFTLKQQNTPEGDELLGTLESLGDRGTFTIAEIEFLHALLLRLSQTADFPVIWFLINEIGEMKADGKILAQQRLKFSKSVQHVLPPDMRIEPEFWHHDRVTEKQLNRLRWWSQRVGEPVPEVKTKGEAHDIIELWLADRPDLEVVWKNSAERLSLEQEPPQIIGSLKPTMPTANDFARSFLMSKFGQVFWIIMLIIALIMTIASFF